MNNPIFKKIAVYFSFAVFALFALFFGATATNAQSVNAKFGKGINVMANDSSFSLKLGARFQTLYSGTSNLETNDWSDQFLIRRARLKLDGFAYDPSLVYKIELSLSNRDTGGGDIPESGNTANIVLDAVLKWNFYKNFVLWVGQTKLPGNRERVVSSQKLQFVDRSLLNGNYNIDRDAGLQLHHSFNINGVVVNEVASISMGEGRNITATNDGGYDYTFRLEVLPFGEFAGGGDYVGSDIAREQTPKLSIGATYDYNNNTTREGGQLGDFLSEERNLSAVFVDAMFKYKGSSVMVEYADKTSSGSPMVIADGEGFNTGKGFNIQAGYLFKNNIELAGRYTTIRPEEFSGEVDTDEYTLGVSRYIVGHSLKVQGDLSYIQEADNDDELRVRVQVEMAF